MRIKSNKLSMSVNAHEHVYRNLFLGCKWGYILLLKKRSLIESRKDLYKRIIK